MLKEVFLGRNPSHFQVNSVVKSFIASEAFIWSAWNLVTPIYAIFAANNIAGGNIEVAASTYSVYLVVRVIFELISGRFLTKTNESNKYVMAILGIIFISLSYLGFATTTTIMPLYFFYAITGIGMGIATPAKNSLFSTHLDKNKEPAEWGMYDPTVFIGMALAATLGGFIAHQYGFKPLFILTAIINILGIIPYLLYIRRDSDY